MTPTAPEPDVPVELPALRLAAVHDRVQRPQDAALLAVLLDVAPFGVAHCDRSGRLQQVNPAFAAVTGAAVEAHVGKPVRVLAPSLASPVAECQATGSPVRGVVLGRDGLRWTAACHPLPDAVTGGCSGVAVVLTPAPPEGEALRRTAMALQHSLLPDQVPSTEELDVAVRYAAGADGTEAGGDWYDVIALGAGRLAVVVGDVMGRGVPAAAVMGQLRTAARTCAQLDLRPSEVLDVLDGVLRDLDDDAIATCLYAVFDPHTREVQLASAGHLPPLVQPRGAEATVLQLAVGAPLGLGEASQQAAVPLHPGTLLALYTDGLVQARGQDVDAGIAGLRSALAGAPADLEELADRVMAQRAGDAGDDVALLLLRLAVDVDARSRTVVVEVPRERALMFDVRSQARLAMRSWMLLDQVVDTATLLASELATNALVHGRGRVELRLRLTRDRLVVESLDSGQHMPRRRRAGDEDEGGRGLQLVAELADRWGSRATEEGKVVWAELELA